MDRIITKMLNFVIFIGIVVILILILLNVIKNRDQYNSQNNLGDEINVINDYEELYIGYSIISKYISYIYGNEYNLFVKLYDTSQTVTEEKFDRIKNSVKEMMMDDIIITSQEKLNDNTYRIKYNSELLGECTMTYFVNKADYTFYIISDSNFGDE